MAELRLLALYPEQMNIYADRGNVVFLERRCAWRGIGFEYAAAGIGDRFDPDAHDLIYIGGGQDRDQRMVAEDLVATKRDAFADAIAGGVAALAVCGGYQLLGAFYELGGERIEGLGVVPLHTIREPGPRLIGNVAIEVDLGSGPRVLAGFENHGGRTYIDESGTPLGHVLHGHGNNGRDGLEGIVSANLVGTYLHGPLLPKNAWLADELIARAIGRREGSRPELEPLDDSFEAAAHRGAVAAAERG
jgi:CobQ-like glutamine amidotransferase family enzyme